MQYLSWLLTPAASAAPAPSLQLLSQPPAVEAIKEVLRENEAFKSKLKEKEDLLQTINFLYMQEQLKRKDLEAELKKALDPKGMLERQKKCLERAKLLESSSQDNITKALDALNDKSKEVLKSLNVGWLKCNDELVDAEGYSRSLSQSVVLLRGQCEELVPNNIEAQLRLSQARSQHILLQYALKIPQDIQNFLNRIETLSQKLGDKIELTQLCKERDEVLALKKALLAPLPMGHSKVSGVLKLLNEGICSASSLEVDLSAFTVSDMDKERLVLGLKPNREVSIKYNIKLRDWIISNWNQSLLNLLMVEEKIEIVSMLDLVKSIENLIKDVEALAAGITNTRKCFKGKLETPSDKGNVPILKAKTQDQSGKFYELYDRYKCIKSRYDFCCKNLGIKKGKYAPTENIEESLKIFEGTSEKITPDLREQHKKILELFAPVEKELLAKFKSLFDKLEACPDELDWAELAVIDKVFSLWLNYKRNPYGTHMTMWMAKTC